MAKNSINDPKAMVMLGKLVVQLRWERKLTQRELAAMAEIDVTYISKIENGACDYLPKLEVLERLAIALGVELKRLSDAAQLYSERLKELVKELQKKYGNDRLEEMLEALLEQSSGR